MTEEPGKEPGMPNHLAGEKSPYLRQHAANPVDWYPWGDEAFRRAAEEKKPVFLSIGYATCHWCHVMARESFEDPEIAAILNAGYIAVKVDREERPDIDSVYMTACRLMGVQGGWPLTIIMTPDKKPFFAATYLPRTTRAGMTGLSGILRTVSGLWQNQQDTLTVTAEQVTAALLAPQPVPEADTATGSLLTNGYDQLQLSFDFVYGGFGRAPKFPAPAMLLFLLRYWKRTGSHEALSMAEDTLDALRCGGIHDHLGGGFHRYSTDREWRVPHFEKMLYDQALLLMAFTEAWQATKKPAYRKTAEAIIEYVTRDLFSPDGSFISAEDADSPGGEGDYYLWTRQELDAVLGPDDGRFAAARFNAEDDGNFSSGGSGKNILYLRPGNGEDPGEDTRVLSVCARLLAYRQARVRPRRDDKILTDWNGLMIAALAVSSRVFANDGYYRTASQAMRFILDRMRSPGGGLLHRYCDGEAAIPAFADDYAFVIGALIELYGTGFDPAWLAEAITLSRYLDRHFADPEQGGYFTTGDRSESLIIRKKEIHDGATPSCNAMMLENLVLLYHLTGDPSFQERAARLADSFSGEVSKAPSACSSFLCALDHFLGPVTGIVIAGDPADPVAIQMIRAIRDRYLPSVTVHFRSKETARSLDGIAPFTRMMPVTPGKTTAYACTGQSCSSPVSNPGQLLELLEGKK